MSGASLSSPGAAAAPAYHKAGSIKRERRWALIGAYIALAVFVVFFLVPPFHMLMTSLKSSAEIADLSGAGARAGGERTIGSRRRVPGIFRDARPLRVEVASSTRCRRAP